MIELVALFLAASLILYVVLAGADFGAGIWEALAPSDQAREQEDLVTDALAPVWEANHVWLILALVIVFNAFPALFREVAVTYHVPLTLLLVGITLRGCAFTFRHYDAFKDDARVWYSRFFRISSLLTPLTLGFVAGGVTLGPPPPHPMTYFEGYVEPWFNSFPLAVGMFVTVLFAFVAAAFLATEARDPALRAPYARRTRRANLAVVVAGAVVFGAAGTNGFDLAGRFLAEPLSVAAMVGATALIVPLSLALRRRHVVLTRLCAGGQATLILVGWMALVWPALRSTELAPEPTLRALLVALVAGSLVIFPALALLFRVFKSAPSN